MPWESSKSQHQEHVLWKPDLFLPANVSPHTSEAGDPYYIGDVYEPSRIGQSGELIESHHLHFKPPAP